ncbi:chemotaxis protein CheW [Desulfuromonas versatilis]|uniref:Chemotaxis protein CheW n=1 Tax=Desulfuromonas versatilis TaxID=2802975 RepID=A0ABM8HXF6_9BACT|nr:chemotaxis protein CheW [Desulfuromonas versatilis]BCR06644.1 chemotaxis protein CheW [Desulfuromonas versatilis]
MTEVKEKTLDREAFAAEEEDTLDGKFLTFHLAGEDYGIEIRYVTEIIGIQKITEVPDLADCVKGVINLRGKVIPVMDVRLRFGLPAREYDDRTCIVVVEIDETAVGLVVDKVNEVSQIPAANIEPPPRTGRESGRYIQGMGKIEDKVKILLDVNRLLFADELQALGELAQTA